MDNYDACYLPDERIIFASTRCFAGVPCVGGGNTVANLCITNPDGSGIRQLCFDQDHNWCPTVLNNGRVLYSRWEYSDLPHYFSRLLFQMNPDGTGQMEYYASNSMWPNSIFYARPIPNDPAKVIAVISGHHGVPRMGELVLFDPARGRREADGVVQRIPGYGQKVDPVIRDGLVEGSWPKFLHPYPLDDKYFLVSCQPTASSPWGLYLADVFDNLLLIKEEPGYALLEPVPLQKTRRPPVIPDRVDLAQSEATVYLTDVYRGEGLRDVPRGAVKQLRVYSPHFAYPGMGGHINIGIDGPWDARIIHGTVPVNPDGSAIFKVPANLPIAVQPLDEQGRALQVMRSWFTAMPGEVLSCVGCHESQNSGPPPQYRLASQNRPADDYALARTVARVQFQTRGPAGPGSLLRRLSRRAASARGQAAGGFHGQERARLARFYAVVYRLAPVRAPSGPGERLSLAAAVGVPRFDQRAGSVAGQRALQRPAGRRVLGPAGDLDRLECSGPRFVERASRRPFADGSPAAGDADSVRQSAGEPGGDSGTAGPTRRLRRAGPVAGQARRARVRWLAL